MNLHDIPALPQRQDSTIDQVHDLIRAGNRLGLYDAVDAVGRLLEADAFDEDVKYGCHLPPVGGGCVLDNGEPHRCIYAKEGMRREQCQYWMKVE